MLNKKLFFNSLLFTIIAFICNEYVFYIKFLSQIVNFALLLLCFYVLNKNIFKGGLLLLFLATILNSRPRELHIIELVSRGDFEYWSFNSMKLGMFTFSTTVFIAIGFYLLFKYVLNFLPRKNINIILIILIITVCSTVIYNLFTPNIYLKYMISDMRNYILLITGYLFVDYCLKNKKIKTKYLDDYIWYVILTNLLLSIAYVFSDFNDDMFKLKYSIDTYHIHYLIFFVMVISLIHRRVWGLIIANCALLFAIPVTRSEQLILILTFVLFISIVRKLIKKQALNNLSIRYFNFNLILIGFSFLISVRMMYLYIPNYYEFFMRKLSFFIDFDSTIDKSASIRALEFDRVMQIHEGRDIFTVLFGKGLGAYFSYNDSSVLQSLDLADYNSFEIRNNMFFQPHFFITYYLLKSGVVGLLLIIYLFIRPLKYVAYELNHYGLLFVLALPYLLFSSYWIPMVGFLSGFFLRLSNYVKTK